MMATNRPSKVFTFLRMAKVLSEQSTCARRKVGAIFVDYRDHIIASGYNGNAYNLAHCIDRPCPGATYVSGEGLSECEAVHAEQNALVQCHDANQIHSVYLTCSPCIHCLKMLLNTPCRDIYFVEEYAGSDKCRKMWLDTGRSWNKIEGV
jgi:dCMP deaminase